MVLNIQCYWQLFKEFGDIETVRFRGAARPDPKTTKKVAVITRKVNEKHQKLFAYIRWVTSSCVFNKVCIKE
jgi:hypothetical protein